MMPWDKPLWDEYKMASGRPLPDNEPSTKQAYVMGCYETRLKYTLERRVLIQRLVIVALVIVAGAVAIYLSR